MKRIQPYFISLSVNLRHCFAALLGSCWLMGCETLINDLDISKLPRAVSKLVVESYISPQSGTIKVVVTESQPLLGPATYMPVIIGNAVVKLSDGEREITIPYIDSTRNYVISSEHFPILAGKKYTLLVSDGKRSVTASCVVPSDIVSPKKYEMDSIPVSGMPDARRIRFRFWWDDLPDVVNYYTVRGYLIVKKAENSQNPRPEEPDHSLLELRHNPRSVLFSDQNLDGFTFQSPVYETDFYVGPGGFYPSVSRIHFEVLNLDENYYRFYRSYSQANDDNPFVEPTLIYSNIEGGLGCFGAYTIGVLDAAL